MLRSSKEFIRWQNGKEEEVEDTSGYFEYVKQFQERMFLLAQNCMEWASCASVKSFSNVT